MFDMSQRGVGAEAGRVLRRPRLLLRAATAGQQTYERSRDLRLLLGGSVPSPREAVARLEAAEQRDEARRMLDSAAYSPQHHVMVLTALLAEQSLLRAAERAGRDAEGSCVPIQVTGSGVPIRAEAPAAPMREKGSGASI